MSNQIPPYRGEAPPRIYNFSGHAIGASGMFHKLGTEKLKSVIQVPTLGASVLPSIGGVSRSEVSNFCREAYYPSRRNLINVHRITTEATGLAVDGKFKTEVQADIESISFVDKLHIESASFYMLSVRDNYDATPVVTTLNRVTGIHLGRATIHVDLDDYLLPLFPTQKVIEAQYPKGGALPHNIKCDEGTYRFNLVKHLEVDQRDEPNQIQLVAPNVVHWDDFGFIFFAEVAVKGDDRQVTLVRLQMGSDAGGSGTVGDGHSNGSAGSN